MKKVLFSALGMVMAICLALTITAVADPGPGIVGLWHFDKVYKDVLTLIQTTPDSSGQNNTGTLELFLSEPVLVDGKFGKALSFDGIDDYVLVSNHSSLNPSGSMTIEAWFKTTDANGGMIVNKDGISSGVNRQYDIHINPDGGLAANFWGPSRAFVNTKVAPNFNPSNYNDGEWHHVAATFNAEDGKVRLSVDGALVGTSVDTISSVVPTSEDVWIGNRWKSPWKFDGIIDEVRIWSRALDADEIMASAQGGLRALWHFNGDLLDASGYANNGINYGSADAAEGKFDKAREFEYSNPDYILVPSSSSLNPTKEITVEAWINIAEEPFPNPNKDIAQKGTNNPAGTGQYSLSIVKRLDGVHAQIWISDGASWKYVESTGIVDTGLWYHIAGAYDGSTLTIYVDGTGTSKVVGAFTINTSTDPLIIGASGNPSVEGQYFDGKIDELRIWARGLSEREILALSNGAELFVPSMIGQRGGPNDSFVVFTSKFSAPGRTSATVMTGIIPSDFNVTINAVDDVTDLITNDKVFIAKCDQGEWALGLSGKSLILTIEFIGKSTPGTGNIRVKLSSGETIHVQVHFK